LVAIAALTGCPPPSGGLSDFDRGYNDGFVEDDRYFEGYDDSWLTEGAGPILYSGGDIPFSDDTTYMAGFWDGEFDAYNDGYFVSYRSAFIIGFSEGYDNGYQADYPAFFATDMHDEFLHGGFSDGYNDGFSEGRVFGAYDYSSDPPFPSNWEDAFFDWEDIEDGFVDAYLEDIGIGTGEFGPVILYSWSEDPNTFKSAKRSAMRSKMRAKGSAAMLRSTSKQGDSIQRPLGETREAELSITPTTSLRNDLPLNLATTWLERVQAANTLKNTGYVSPRTQ
jgi:hypothetical protein